MCDSQVVYSVTHVWQPSCLQCNPYVTAKLFTVQPMFDGLLIFMHLEIPSESENNEIIYMVIYGRTWYLREVFYAAIVYGIITYTSSVSRRIWFTDSLWQPAILQSYYATCFILQHIMWFFSYDTNMAITTIKSWHNSIYARDDNIDHVWYFVSRHNGTAYCIMFTHKDE